MARFSISLKPAEEPPKPLTKIFNTFYPAHNSHNDKKSRLEQGGESDGMGISNQLASHTTHTHTHTSHWPSGCTSTFHPVAYYIEEGGQGRESATSSSSNCCKSAKPQMLSVTQKSTLSPPSLPPLPHLPSKPPIKQTHRKVFPFLPFPSHALHALDAVDKALQFACHLLWQLIVGLPSCQLDREGGEEEGCGGRLRRLRAIANKKGGKSTLLWHLILILLPYLSIDSGDCRGIR